MAKEKINRLEVTISDEEGSHINKVVATEIPRAEFEKLLQIVLLISSGDLSLESLEIVQKPR